MENSTVRELLPTAQSSRYLQYEARIRSLRRLLDCVRRHRLLITLLAVLAVGLAMGFLLTVGSFMGTFSCGDHVYGDAPLCSLRAFLSDVTYQYAAVDAEGVWSDTAPASLGEYRIRAVSKNGFGTPRYSEDVTITILARELTVRISDSEFIYGDFTTDTARQHTQFDGLAPGDTVTDLEYHLSQDGSGGYAVSLQSLRIENSAGKDVTGCYTVTATEGYFAMLPRPITVTAENAEKVYDGKVWDQSTAALTEGTLAPGDRVQILFDTLPADAGEYPITPQCTVFNADGEDVTIRYTLSICSGHLSVTRRTVCIATGSAEKQYDEAPLTNEDWLFVSGSLAEGHTISGKTTGSQTLVGSSSNTVTLTVTDASGQDVSANYWFSTDLGTLTVTPIVLKFETYSAEKVYDGKILKADCRLIEGEVLKGHSLSYHCPIGQTNAGTCRNKITVKVTNKEGVDVTADYYTIEVDYGTLKVTPRPITITSGSAEKLYDGTPLICYSYDITDGKCYGGDAIRSTNFTGRQTEVGSSPNTFSVKIKDENGLDKTHCYEITYVFGTLTVHENPNPPENGTGSDLSGSSPGLQNAAQESYITFPRGSNPTVLAKVTAINGLYSGKQIYFRYASYGDYTGSSWKAAVPYNVISVCPLDFIPSALSLAGKRSVSIKIDLMNDCPFLLASFSSFGRTNDCYIEYDKPVYYLSVYAGLDYADLKDLRVPKYLNEREAAYRAYVYETYLQIPASTEKELLKWAEENGLRADSETLVEDIQQAILNAAAYNRNADSYPDGVDTAVYFLTEAKEGICQHFATAATLMYRAFGIPARYVTGLVGTVKNNVTTELTGNDAHAWVEIYVDGLGWVPMEVTGSNSEITTKTNLQVMAYGAVKYYDGEGFEDYDLEQFTIFSGSLREGDRLVVTFRTGKYAVSPGTYKNEIAKCVVYDANGKDVTSKYYNIQAYSADLIILPRPITITIGSASKIYDGLPLSCRDYWISSGSLAPGDVLSMEISTALTDPGTAENTYDAIQIWAANASGKKVNVTECYQITVESGQLEVLPDQ